MKNRLKTNSESEGSLFHYTKNLKTLNTIIKTGFRYGYCFEEHSERVAKGDNWSLMDNVHIMNVQQPQYGIATPMICFCDIPLLKASGHRNKYGKYCIGVNKELIRKELPSLNPLLYCTSNWVYDSIEKLANYIPTKEEVTTYYKSLETITKEIDNPIQKAIEINKAKKDGIITRDIRFEPDFICAVNTLISLVKKCDATNSKYYNEHEWRVYYTEAGIPMYDFIHEQFLNQKKELNKQLWNDKEKAYLKFDNPEEIITYIIVSKEKEIPELIEKIKKLKSILGKPIPKDKDSHIKDIIISKITSFERIKADY